MWRWRGSDVLSAAPGRTARWPDGPRAVPGVGAPLLAAALVFLTVRMISITVVAALAGPAAVGRRLSSWDGGYYLQIARDGYPQTLAGDIGQGSAVAFFPLDPALIRVAAALTPGGLTAGAILLTLLAGAAAAALIAATAFAALVPRLGPGTARRAALAVAAMWSAQPASFVLSMAYSEALFTALAAACLLALLSERWWLAGVMALLAGATRSTGVVLLACCVAAAWPVWRRRPAALLAVALAPAGAAAYLGWAAARYGQLDAWFVAQRQGWGMYWDGGVTTVREVGHYLLHPGQRPLGLAVIATIAAALVLLAALVRQRPPVVLVGYAAGIVAVGLTTHGVFGSLPRFLLPAFPLLLPLGPFAARLPAPLCTVLIGLAAVLGGGATGWISGQTVLPP